MSRGNTSASALRSRTARFYLWTIRRQDDIGHLLGMNAWICVYMLLVLAVFTPMPLETALQILFLSGLCLGAVLWMLIERRRSWLLGIHDACLRKIAHQVMLDYIRNKTAVSRGSRKSVKRPP